MRHVSISFLPFMFERIRAGTKTQTRRPLKYKNEVAMIRYHVGDLLWVKERSAETKNARFMPKRLARTWLEVLETYLEPLSEISEADAKAEGSEYIGTYRGGFEAIWKHLYQGGPYQWANEQIVSVVKFRLIEPPEGIL